MKLSPQEKAARRESFRRMNAAGKAEYIFTYFKGPILLALAAVIVAGSALHRQLTKKEPVVYLGFANVAVGEDLERRLTEDYINAIGGNPKKQQVLPYTGLYLTRSASGENHQYAYASQLKLMASINAKKLDVVLMNKEAYDLLSGSGYLLELSGALTEGSRYLTENDTPDRNGAVNAMELSQVPGFREAGLSGQIYAGVIANTARLSQSIRYLEYLASLSSL